jgi:hypothetical protein
LHLRTERRREGYVLPESEGGKIERLLERYGLKQEQAEEPPVEHGAPSNADGKSETVSPDDVFRDAPKA